MDGWVSGWMERWMDGQMGGWLDVWMERRDCEKEDSMGGKK